MYYNEESAEILFETAKEMNLKPEWITEYGLFTIKVKNKLHYIFYTNSVLNTQLCQYVTRNKHTTRVILEKNNIPNIPYLLPKSIEDVTQFLKEYKQIIIKPTMGSRSQNVRLISDESQLHNINIEDSIVEKYIKGKELRYLVLEGKIIGVMEKIYTTPVHDPNNVKRAVYPEIKWDKKLVDLSLKVAEIFYLNFGSVDYIIDKQGINHILEVNSAPAIRKFHHPDEGKGVDVARMFIKAMIRKLSIS